MSIRFTVQGWLRRRCNDRQARRLFPSKDKLAITTLTSSSWPESFKLRLMARAETFQNRQHFSPLLARAQIRFTKQRVNLTDILLRKFICQALTRERPRHALRMALAFCHGVMSVYIDWRQPMVQIRAGCGSVVILEPFFVP
jgi:hypothetical protein